MLAPWNRKSVMPDPRIRELIRTSLLGVRNSMRQAGEISTHQHVGIDWYTLPNTDPDMLQTRLALQAETVIALRQGSFNQRLGQTLEITTYKALLKLENPIFLADLRIWTNKPTSGAP
jgi:hypothetical protein